MPDAEDRLLRSRHVEDAGRLPQSSASCEKPTRPRHLLADLFGCGASRLDDEAGIRRALREGAELSGATIVSDTFHRFPGGGVTGVVAVQESHLTIHTWPDAGYGALDIFFCGRPDPGTALRHVVRALRPTSVRIREYVRGDELGS